MLKILIVGAKGQLGQEFTDSLAKGYTDIGKIDDVFAGACVDAFDIDKLDILNKQNLDDVLKNGYDFCINCSAYTAVDKAEDDVENCYKVNVLGVQNLAFACKTYGTTLVHFSTDYVYQGNSNIPLNETDQTLPVTVYGKTKLAGENYIRDICEKYYIFRTSWLYGQFGNNFVYKMLELSKKMDKLTVVNDQIGTPTNANDLVYNTLKVIQSGYYGLYNCTGEGQCSWYDFACEILKINKIHTPVLPVSSSAFNSRAVRPAFSVLDNLALKSIGMNYMRDWKESLHSFFVNKSQQGE